MPIVTKVKMMPAQPASGDVVIVHEENQPRGKWRVGNLLDLIAGADSCIRGALVEVRSKGGTL